MAFTLYLLWGLKIPPLNFKLSPPLFLLIGFLITIRDCLLLIQMPDKSLSIKKVKNSKLFIAKIDFSVEKFF